MSLWERFLNLFRRRKGVRVTRAMEAQARRAMEYAETVLHMRMPFPCEWNWVRGEYQKDGRWYYTAAAARCQYMPRCTRIVVYCGPHGEQAQDVYEHEAGHAVLRLNHHPKKYENLFKNWVDT